MTSSILRSRKHRLRQPQGRSSPTIPDRRLSNLETVGVIAQIFLAMVAIFGYFYTVRPIYQKEQLAEQVAEYDSIIRKQTPKIKEIEAQLIELSQERSVLATELERERLRLTTEFQRDRTRMTAELKTLERQVIAAEEAKQKVEKQTEFMTYRYRTPDGAPAVTKEQVRSAQQFNLRRSVLSAISTTCSLHSFKGTFPRYRHTTRDAKNLSWPFTDAELLLWKEHGERIPLRRVTECIDLGVSRFASDPSLVAFASDIENLRTEALKFAERAASSKPWVSPVQPADVPPELASRLTAIQNEQAEELKQVEEKYKGWELSFGDRRVLLKHNYEVEKRNASTNALSKRWDIEAKVRKKADQLNEAIDDEVKRLTIDDRK